MHCINNNLGNSSWEMISVTLSHFMEQVSTTNQNKISRLFLIATLIEYGLIYGPFLVSIDFKYEVGGLDWSTQFFFPFNDGKSTLELDFFFCYCNVFRKDINIAEKAQSTQDFSLSAQHNR